MVRLTGSLIDLTAQGTEGRAIEDVIDTYDKRTGIEGEAEAIASLDEGILQPFTDLPPGIGQGGIIEVTADDDTLSAIALYELMDDIGLYTMVGASFASKASFRRSACPREAKRR